MKRLTIAATFIMLVGCKRPVDSQTTQPEIGYSQDSIHVDVKKETIDKMQGTWVHMEDSLATVEIAGDNWVFKYEGDDVTNADSFKIQFTDSTKSFLRKADENLFFLLTNETEELEYEVIGLSSDIMSLMYFPRGNTHTYRRIK